MFGGMDYRPPYPAELEKASEMVVADEARYLADADLYVLTPEMCAVAVAAAQALGGMSEPCWTSADSYIHGTRCSSRGPISGAPCILPEARVAWRSAREGR